MPIEFTPPRRLLNAFLRLRARQRGADGGPDTGPKLTVETVETVNDDGTYQVRGATLRPTGLAQLEPGQGVTVAWKQGAPGVIVAHQVQRAQFPQIAPGGGQVVEMLFLAPVAATTPSITDVWFRNASQTTLLTGGTPPSTCRAQLAAAGFTIVGGSYVLWGWGLDHRRFVVQFTNAPNHPVFAVFKMAGDEKTPITTKASAKLETTYDVGASGLGLGTITWDQNILGGGHTSTPLVLGVLASVGYSVFVGSPPNILIQTAGGGVVDVVLRRDRHLVVVLALTIVNQDDSLTPFGTLRFTYPYLIDLTAGTVLVNGIATQGIWPGGIYDGAHFINAGIGAFSTPGGSKFGDIAVRMIPTRRGNVQRVFASLRATNLPFGIGLPGSTFQWVGAHLFGGAPGPTTIFQVQHPTSNGDGTRTFFISRNQRYVLWARAGPPGGQGASAFGDPFASALTDYTFREGLRVADLGAAEVLVVADKVVLTDRDAIIALLDTTPFLVSPGLLYQDFNDLRVLPPTNTKPHFSVFRDANGVIAPFPSPLKTLSSLSAVDDLKAFRPAEQFILTAFADDYTVSGHSDPVVGYSIVGDQVFVQVLPVDGVPIPTS